MIHNPTLSRFRPGTLSLASGERLASIFDPANCQDAIALVPAPSLGIVVSDFKRAAKTIQNKSHRWHRLPSSVRQDNEGFFSRKSHMRLSRPTGVRLAGLWLRKLRCRDAARRAQGSCKRFLILSFSLLSYQDPCTSQHCAFDHSAKFDDCEFVCDVNQLASQKRPHTTKILSQTLLKPAMKPTTQI